MGKNKEYNPSESINHPVAIQQLIKSYEDEIKLNIRKNVVLGKLIAAQKLKLFSVLAGMYKGRVIKILGEDDV